MRQKELIILANLPLHFLQAAVRLYGEVAPAVLRNYTGDAQNDSKAELSVKWQEFTLNYVITPGAIDLQQKLAEIRDTLRSGQETLLTHEGELALVKLIAGFANELCLLAEQHASSSNPYASFIADEFMFDFQRVAAATAH